MDITKILSELRGERDRLEKAIVALESVTGTTASRKGRVTTTAPKKRGMSAAGRKRLSLLLKKRWAQGKMGRKKAA